LIQTWKEKIEEQTQIYLKESPNLFTGKVGGTAEESKESQQAAVVAVNSNSNSAVMPNVSALEDS